jgi:hypothetical protein
MSTKKVIREKKSIPFILFLAASFLRMRRCEQETTEMGREVCHAREIIPFTPSARNKKNLKLLHFLLSIVAATAKLLMKYMRLQK